MTPRVRDVTSGPAAYFRSASRTNCPSRGSPAAPLELPPLGLGMGHCIGAARPQATRHEFAFVPELALDTAVPMRPQLGVHLPLAALVQRPQAFAPLRLAR